jgi:tetratricopeptide (TPR) repeat protein
MSLPELDQTIPVPKLCLNMIVKNESKIIKRLLLSVSKLIDMYCICDTGSTDDTVEIIETFFKEKKIPGKVITEPFRDFGYNRSYALKACESMDADYILLLDADMVFWKNLSITPENFKRYLVNFDLFYIYQGTETFYYKNTRIVKNKMGFSYWGVTHEYVNSPKNSRSGQLDKDICFIKDIGDGGSKTNKFLRDVELLKKGLETEPNNDRYTFYLANSLKDLGKKEEAIEYYNKRIQIGGWIEEVWHSYYSMGKCYQEIGNMDSAICMWMQGYEAYPNRIENLYEIVKHYRIIGKQKLAKIFYDIANESRTKYKERDYLFMQKDIYDYKLDYELSIIGYYHNPEKLKLDVLSMGIMAYPHIEHDIARNVLSNYKFYSEKVILKDNGKWRLNNLKNVLDGIGNTLNIPSNRFPHFVPSTPTFCSHPVHKNRIFVNKRFVNYYINDKGGYENQEFIETKNVLAELEQNKDTKEWKLIKESFLNYDNSYDDRYVGLEDVRLMSFQNNILYNANRGLVGNKMVIEHGWINKISFGTEDALHLEYNDQQQIEKNWVMFENNSSLNFVYHWFPMTIGKLEKNKFILTNTIQTPYLFKFVRGSTNGIEIRDEIWFLCHVVSYEDRRYYYHVIVMMNKKTNSIRYTKLFTFEQDKVEYSLGMMYRETEKDILFGYSIMDRETKYMSIDLADIDKIICC